MSTESAAIRQCRETIARGSKSFALASQLLPKTARDHAAVVYTFCRRADDAVDEAAPDVASRALLRLRAELDAVYGHAPLDEITLEAFRDVVRVTGIPRAYPEELLTGMAMDVENSAYSTLSDLLLYCYRVASTVGLMMCHVLGVSDARALRNAAHLGVAMQLTNVCRDVAEDWQRGRLYLPDELLARHGCGELRSELGGPLPASARPAIAAVTRELLREADRYYASGDAGLPALPVRCALAVRAARLIYAAIGERIAAHSFDPMAGRAIVPTRDKLRLLADALTLEGGELRGRLGRWLRAPGPRPPLRDIASASDVLPLPS